VTGRGNFTTAVARCFPNCSDSSRTYTYDLTGQVTSSTDALGNTTTYSHTDSPVGGNPAGNSDAYLTQITDPLGYTVNFTYNYTTGELASSTDENGQITTYTYDDPLGRLTQMNYPDGGETAISYNDSVPSVTTTTLQTPNPPKNSTAIMDGLGHVTQTQLTSDPSGTDYVDTTYDGEGHVYSNSNPHRSTPSSTDGTTWHYYDAMGRTIQTTEPDGSILQWCYLEVPSQPAAANCSAHLGSVAGSWVDSTDEVGNHWQRTSDSFGSLTEVMEPNGAS